MTDVSDLQEDALGEQCRRAAREIREAFDEAKRRAADWDFPKG